MISIFNAQRVRIEFNNSSTLFMCKIDGPCSVYLSYRLFTVDVLSLQEDASYYYMRSVQGEWGSVHNYNPKYGKCKTIESKFEFADFRTIGYRI